VLVTVLWSSSWVLIRLGLDGESLPPLRFAALRYGSAAAVLTLWTLPQRAHRRQLASIGRRLATRLLLLGVVFYGITQGAQFVAIDSQPAATTSLVLSFTPLLVAGLAHRSLDEAASWRQVAGTVIVAAGAAVYFVGDLGATGPGMAASLVGLAANVAAALLGRSLNRSAALPPVLVTSFSMSAGAFALGIVSLAVDGWPVLSTRAALIVGWLAVVNTALAFTLWNRSLQRLSAVESAGINNTMLIQIAVLAWIFLNERPGPAELAGVVAVSAGVLLTQAPTGIGRSAVGASSPRGKSRAAG
jgi:drug/metabolite transporter (DMT)-like permease